MADGVQSTAIIGGSIGGAAVLLLVVAAAVLMFYLRKKTRVERANAAAKSQQGPAVALVDLEEWQPFNDGTSQTTPSTSRAVREPPLPGAAWPDSEATSSRPQSSGLQAMSARHPRVTGRSTPISPHALGRHEIPSGPGSRTFDGPHAQPGSPDAGGAKLPSLASESTGPSAPPSRPIHAGVAPLSRRGRSAFPTLERGRMADEAAPGRYPRAGRDRVASATKYQSELPRFGGAGGQNR